MRRNPLRVALHSLPLVRFVSPALYANEQKYVVRVVGGGYAMYALGVAVSYFLIFPLTFRFLGTYQVSGEVENIIHAFVRRSAHVAAI